MLKRIELCCVVNPQPSFPAENIAQSEAPTGSRSLPINDAASTTQISANARPATITSVRLSVDLTLPESPRGDSAVLILEVPAIFT